MFIKHGQLLFKLSVIILYSQQLLHTDEPMLSIQDHTLNFGKKKEVWSFAGLWPFSLSKCELYSLVQI